MVKAKGIRKSFGSKIVLRGIDLQVSEGETLAIFGPNGAGKTTLLKILATAVKPSAGDVIISDIPVKREPLKARRHLALVTHQTYLYGQLTVRENLDLYSRIYQVKDIPERITELAEKLGFLERLSDRANTLSRGLKQRVSIARALLHKPRLLLLDEPESGLDQEAISRLWGIVKEDNRTIILTTHNLEWGLASSDKLAILTRGNIKLLRETAGISEAEIKELYSEFVKK